MKLNRSRTLVHKTLAAPWKDEAERVLEHLANIPDLPLGTVITPTRFVEVEAPSGERRRVGPFHNMRADSIEKMRWHYRAMFENCSENDMLALRGLIRKAWASTDRRERDWLVFLLRKLHAEAIRLRRGFQDDPEKMVRDWKSRDDYARERLAKLVEAFASDEKSRSPADWLYSFLDGQLEAAYRDGPPPRSEFEEIAFYFQLNLDRARYCPNPECPAPYFLANKKGQKYCGTECAEYGQRKSAREAWHRHPEWRKKKRGSETSGSKPERPRN